MGRGEGFGRRRRFKVSEKTTEMKYKKLTQTIDETRNSKVSRKKQKENSGKVCPTGRWAALEGPVPYSNEGAGGGGRRSLSFLKSFLKREKGRGKIKIQGEDQGELKKRNLYLLLDATCRGKGGESGKKSKLTQSGG